MKQEQTKHKAEIYVDEVLSGKIITSRLVKDACKRHQDDLAESAKPNGEFYFDSVRAAYVCKCIEILCKHTVGDLAGTPFILSPWQAFIVWSIFGWKCRATKKRRFTRVYIEVARKNGKSTFAAAIALFMFILDGEEGAQVFSAATKREQAEIVWKEASRMVSKSSDLRKVIKRHRNSLIYPDQNATFVPLSSDAQTLDGLNVSCAIIDEFHAHANSDMWDVLDTATGSRAQPLILIITTAGTNQFGVGFEIRSMMVDILNKNRKNEHWFGFIAAIDPKDAYSDESCWIKANPNLPFIATLLPDLREQSSRASSSAAQMNNFLVKRLNRWTAQNERWLSIEDWDKCKAQFTYEDMLGRPAFVGIDYAQVSDLSASCLCFPPINEGDKYRYLWKFYLPSDTIDKYTQNNDSRWREWVNSGELISTIGTITDQSIMIADLLQWSKDFDIRQVGFDPYNMRQFASKALEDGIDMVELGQSMAYLNEPTKEFERQIVSKQLEHNGNTIMRWMIDNVSLDYDNHGHCMPHKPKQQSKGKKIDGVMGAVLACAVAIRNPIEINNSVGFFFA